MLARGLGDWAPGFFIMRTIKRHLSRRRPRGDYEALCDLCGVMWHRSKMRKDAAGRLRCPDDIRGRDPVTLARLNAEAAARDGYPVRVRDGGNIDSLGPATTGSGNFTDGQAADDYCPPHRTTAADIAIGDVAETDTIITANGVNVTANNITVIQG